MEFERILVPVDGTETDEEAISLACTISKVSGKTRVFAVHIIPVERALPLDAELSSAINKSEGIQAKAEEIAEKQGVKLETDLLQAREVANAIIDEAVEKEIDLILIGLSYKTRFGEFCMGGVLPYILQNAPCRVIVYHQRKV
jgi:nucleotide-binding universal stress UspA family protein